MQVQLGGFKRSQRLHLEFPIRASTVQAVCELHFTERNIWQRSLPAFLSQR
jgi:hypothetical protein